MAAVSEVAIPERTPDMGRALTGANAGMRGSNRRYDGSFDTRYVCVCVCVWVCVCVCVCVVPDEGEGLPMQACVVLTTGMTAHLAPGVCMCVCVCGARQR